MRQVLSARAGPGAASQQAPKDAGADADPLTGGSGFEMPQLLPRRLAGHAKSSADGLPGCTTRAHVGDQIALEAVKLRPLLGDSAEHPHQILLAERLEGRCGDGGALGEGLRCLACTLTANHHAETAEEGAIDSARKSAESAVHRGNIAGLAHGLSLERAAPSDLLIRDDGAVSAILDHSQYVRVS